MNRHALPVPDVDDPACFNSEDPDLWYATDFASIHAAKKICARCPGFRQCLTWAITHDERHGVWAATTPDDRDRLINQHHRSPA